MRHLSRNNIQSKALKTKQDTHSDRTNKMNDIKTNKQKQESK